MAALVGSVGAEKLIEQQEKRKQEFRKNIEVNPSAITITSVDEQLIQKCLEYIEKNMDNPEYGVEAVSYTHLYTVFGGESTGLTISNLKSFSCKGWSDGIDLMCCSVCLCHAFWKRWV